MVKMFNFKRKVKTHALFVGFLYVNNDQMGLSTKLEIQKLTKNHLTDPPWEPANLCQILFIV